MRLGIIIHGGRYARHAAWPARNAPPLSAVAQGREAQPPYSYRPAIGLQYPPVAVGHGRSRQAEAALHPALGLESLRGVIESRQGEDHDPRPRLW